MSDLVSISRGLFVSPELDKYNEIELNLDDYGVSTWLDRSEILVLVAHLIKVLAVAEEKAKK